MPTESDEQLAARQAHWLAALAEALAEAQRLTALLLRLRPDSHEAAQVRLHIRGVSKEVDALRRATGYAPPYAADETLWAMQEPARTPRPVTREAHD